MSGIIVDVLAGRKVGEVMRETWGHLDAKPGVRYQGVILFAAGAFGGEQVILHSEFGEAGYGPWFYEGIHDWLCEQETEPGRLYRFEGFYRLKRNGEHEFTGTVTTTELEI